MKITRTSLYSGKTRTLEIPVSESQLKEWTDGKLIQNIMPDLDKSQREFLMTGMTDEEWDKMTSEKEE